MSTRLTEIVRRVQEVCAMAHTKYNLDLSNLDVRLDLRGKAAGKAGHRGSAYYIRLNVDMIQNESFAAILKDTIPHEIAHIVCFLNPALGANHDKGWKRVCLALGGTGSTTHTEPVTLARKTRKFRYVSTSGREVLISLQRHRAIQGGKLYILNVDGSKLSRLCEYQEVLS